MFFSTTEQACHRIYLLVEFARKSYDLPEDSFVFVVHDSPDDQFHGETHWAKGGLKLPTIEIKIPAKYSHVKLARLVFHEMYHARDQHVDPTTKMLKWSYKTEPQPVWHERPEEVRAEGAAKELLWQYAGGEL